jgi:PBP1b-binding outer membrane lipoprotein LpoB
MKNKINIIVIAFVCLIFFDGCSKSANVNSSGNTNRVIDNANTALATNTTNKKPTAPAAMQPDSKFNAANFNKLDVGMKYADVVNILGSEGEIVSDSGLSGKTVMYKWTDASGSFVKVIFQDGKLLDKVQTGLR